MEPKIFMDLSALGYPRFTFRGNQVFLILSLGKSQVSLFQGGTSDTSDLLTGLFQVDIDLPGRINNLTS